ncbi:MAG: hypothetical protein ING66_04080 [Rhodocyclaceae bacterium]|nr:hypothetical protein [Rhodocyclaceae bacterium]MCA3084606.1 hypothetical protein [Rhodocyclaceae bacterium]
MENVTKRLLIASAVAASLTVTMAVSAAPAPDESPKVKPAGAAAEKKQVFALVSAVGDQFTYVRQKESTGSNIIDNNVRRTLKAQNNGLNLSVLRGLDTAIGNAHPDSERVFITLNPTELDNVLPQDREAVAIGKLVSELEKLPERTKWDKIIVATPTYVQSERRGMGPKLHGLGIYVQPLTGGGSIEGQDGNPEIDVSNQGESDTTNPEDGKKNKSKVYIAPYSYIQVYVIDAKTMRVLEKNARHDFQKLNDPNSTAIDIGRSIPMDVLAKSVGDLIERSAARAVGETEFGVSVTIQEVKPVAATPAKK